MLLGVLHGGAARAVVGWGRGWERLPRLLALVVFLLTLLVLAVVGGEHGPAIAAVTGAVALGVAALQMVGLLPALSGGACPARRPSTSSSPRRSPSWWVQAR